MDYSRRLPILVLFALLLGLAVIQTAESFAPLYPATRSRFSTCNGVVLAAAAQQGGKKKGKRKRRRKQRPGTTASPAEPVAGAVETKEAASVGESLPDKMPQDEELSEEDLAVISEVAKFEFKSAAPEITKGIQDSPIVTETTPENADDTAIPLPDIKQVKQRKRLEEEQARIEQEKEDQKVRIKRSDKEAFARLLEQQPFADADASLFEEEPYGTVSALLGEKAKPFLGIPFGPLQVGHFIGALGIVLMAFVEYPGFPLTNLPTPLRECLQGGLATVYSINIVLAVFSVFKAKERSQPVPLWVAKTFSVGGLAYDQLVQLPTTAEIERAKAVKGKRALKNRKR